MEHIQSLSAQEEQLALLGPTGETLPLALLLPQLVVVGGVLQVTGLMEEVVEAEDPRWVGRRVVGEINLACGACQWCRRGLGRHCP